MRKLYEFVKVLTYQRRIVSAATILGNRVGEFRTPIGTHEEFCGHILFFRQYHYFIGNFWQT